MIVEIWAESGRNARVAEFTRQLDRDVLKAWSSWSISPRRKAPPRRRSTPRFAASVLFTLVAGLFKRKAVEPDFDLEAEFAMALGVFKALFAAHWRPARRSEMGRLLLSLIVARRARQPAASTRNGRCGRAIRRCCRSTNGARRRGRNARPRRPRPTADRRARSRRLR